MKVFKNAWFGRFMRKEKISAVDLLEAVFRAEKGQIDADLGGGVIKQRIARPGEGKSKGYRSIVLFRKGKQAFFVYGFPKSALGNIREDEEEQFKKMAKYVLALTEEQLKQLIEVGQFEEVLEDDRKIS
ncbi:type II toxin-antitoxin system RelE/ParE family toxin [Ferrovum sp.]|uniref:type II toxin-antitoxin system RelE/ParE family toxin n=1 Tax=Ferrovum sp. TaxID=2609467 RepID=UPI00261C3324|nr:type II toxin-antitoxin system RelE/ParE family toxin [Ferrovum sp.]